METNLSRRGFLTGAAAAGALAAMGLAGCAPTPADEGGTKTKTFAMKYNVKTGDYVAFKINQGGTGFSQMIKLTELSKVSFSSWIGDNAVTFGSRTYEVPSDVLCFNKDNGEWITLTQAKTYADAANLYVKDGVVRVIEVRS